MKISACVLALASSAAAFSPAKNSRQSVQLSETKADLEKMAADLNPIVKVRLQTPKDVVPH